MSEIERRVKEKLTSEDRDFLEKILALPVSRIRSFLEEEAEKVA